MKKRMNEAQRKEKLRTLTWDYFWEAKLREFFIIIILFVILIILFVILIIFPFLIGNLLVDNEIIFKQRYCDIMNEYTDGYNGQCDFFDRWLAGVITLFSLCLIGLIPYFIIKSNWEKAKGKAEDDLDGY